MNKPLIILVFTVIFYDIYIVLFIFRLWFNDGNGMSTIIGSIYFKFCSNGIDRRTIVLLLFIIASIGEHAWDPTRLGNMRGCVGPSIFIKKGIQWRLRSS